MDQISLLPTTLSEAKATVMEKRWSPYGVTCPCCLGMAKVYRRKFNRTMGKILAQMYIWHRADPWRWRHVKNEWPHKGKTFNAEYARMVDYALIEAPHDIRPDGNPDTGHHRITVRGIGFIEGRLKVPAVQMCYKGQVIDQSEETIDIDGVLGEPFDYRTLWETVT